MYECVHVYRSIYALGSPEKNYPRSNLDTAGKQLTHYLKATYTLPGSNVHTT